jgi:hypothetical protein
MTNDAARMPFKTHQTALGATIPAGQGKSTGQTAAPVLASPRGHDAIERRRAERLASVPARYRKLHRRAWAGKSLRAAVSCFCLECIGYLPDEVRRCSAFACPLFSVRPHQECRLGAGGAA